MIYMDIESLEKKLINKSSRVVKKGFMFVLTRVEKSTVFPF